MKHRPAPYKPARCAADCYDWLTPKDVIRHALAAFYASCRQADDYEREHGPIVAKYLAKVGRPGLAIALAENLLQRLNEAGLQALLPEFKPDRYDVEIQAWSPDIFPPEIVDGAPSARARVVGEYVDNSP